jgi:NAD(P)-dependent dehydrogenase (short-subunit alcohol dehydrogenase family)
MLLKDKNAVIYGAGGSIGGAVARVFGREGANVFLAGRTRATLDAVADDIRAAGGTAETAEVDALDEASVDAHADAISGGIDISFNLIALGDVQGTPMAEMELADFMAPIDAAVRGYFLTARAAARSMIPRGGGVILTFGGEGDPIRDYSIGGLQVAFHAVEAMRRQLATELGRHGIRTVTLRTGGIPESISEGFEGRERITEMLEGATLLGRTATLEDVGNVAAFVASDQGRTMTAATVNVSCGALLD